MESKRGRSAVRTSSDAPITWASTHPPIVTDPMIRPSAPTHIRAPSLRGLVPSVLTSVATTAFSP
jgi:hypothetical protein